MKPKQRRDRLFKASRPNIRPMELFDESGKGKDINILWGAHKMGTFNLPDDAEQDEFAEIMMDVVEPYEKKWIIEDNNAQFGEGYGPIGMMCAVYNGWEIEPHFEAFKWASPRNTLRAVVSFLQMMRYDKDVGIVNVYSLKDSKDFFHHISQYGVLRFATKIPDGDLRGDKYVYYIRGRKSANS